jgi:hypothetical protein
MLHIVTPLSRISNLHQIENSFGEINSHEVKWVVLVDGAIRQDFIESGISLKFAEIVFSPINNAFVGHAHRNFYLDNYSNETDWIMFLDDDTILCENYGQLAHFKQVCEQKNQNCFVINQLNQNLSLRLIASHENIRVCMIDMGQYCVKMSSIPQNLRFQESNYCADGIFIEEYKNLLGIESINVFDNESVYSFYNYLRP